jgi:hypothetical protein
MEDILPPTDPHPSSRLLFPTATLSLTRKYDHSIGQESSPWVLFISSRDDVCAAVCLIHNEHNEDEKLNTVQLLLMGPEIFGFIFIFVFLGYSTFLLQKIRQYFPIFCKFAEFPNRRRPKCTTMPWNIWPSSVVLWGVCWMFYPSSSYLDNTPSRFPLHDEYLPLFDPRKTPSYTIGS